MEAASTGRAQLKDGVFEEPAAPDSATKTKIWLGDLRALGDINGDGAEDALVTLVVDPGGSGTFTYLALVLNENGKARPFAAVLLGDRILVKIAEAEKKTASGIIIPDTAQEKTQTGIVIAVGTEKDVITVKEGDRVMYDKYAGTTIKVGGEEQLILKAADVLAKVE